MIYDHPVVGFIYNHSPSWAQDGWVSCYGLLRAGERRSPAFREYRRDLEASQWWSVGELLELQNERVRALVAHCYANVPYYRTVMDQRHLTPQDFVGTADLYKLPRLTKELIRLHADELRATNIPPRKTTTGRSGGTTGVPLAFAIDNTRLAFERAMVERAWSWGGFHAGDDLIMIRGFTAVPQTYSGERYWRRDWFERRTYLSSFHVSRATLPMYAERLTLWPAQFIAGYPSSLSLVARFMRRAGMARPTKATFTSSETLSDPERRVIQEVFGCNVFDYYGMGERTAAAQQCAEGTYHINSEFGVIQVDDEAGDPADPDEVGDLIHTGLTNLSMPLIRYVSGDRGSLAQGGCGCGRGLPVLRAILGRKDDAIITQDGRVMPQAGLDQIHEFAPNVERCQLVQTKLDEVVIRVQPREGFGRDDRKSLEQQLRKRIGQNMAITIEIVEQLELTVTGKHRFIVSQLSDSERSGAALV